MLYRNTPLGHDLSSSMELLCARDARSTLPVSHASLMQVKQAATTTCYKTSSGDYKSNKQDQAQATSNLLPIGTHVMYKMPPSKLWYPGIITNILQDSLSYLITTQDYTTYGCARFNLKTCKPYNLSMSLDSQVFAQTLPQTTYNNIPSKWLFKQISASGNCIEAPVLLLRWINKCDMVTFLYKHAYW